jgi:hypothetical protein
MVMVTIFVVIDENGKVNGWSSSHMEGSIEVQIPEDHEFLSGNPFLYRYVDNKLLRDSDIELESAKKKKDDELNSACKEAILDGFEYEVDGIVYKFSYDMEAQINFGDAKDILNEGLVPSIPWTVKNPEGEYSRISVDKALMYNLTFAIMQHKTDKISRYRDILLPVVRSAETLEEVNGVTWEGS